MSDCLSSYLNGTLLNKINFQLPEDEVRFIEKGVKELVKELADAIVDANDFDIRNTVTEFEHHGKTYLGIDTIDIVKQYDIVGQGSYYDGTKIGFPDEFDFLFVICRFNCTTRKEVYCKNGQLNYPPFEFRYIHRKIKSLVNGKKFKYQSSSADDVKGCLWINEYKEKKGPSSKLEIRYKKGSDWIKQSIIHVDLVPAFQIVDINMADIIGAHCKSEPFLNHLLTNGMDYYFHVERLSFSTAEADFMRFTLSKNHQCVYKLLKYLLNGYEEGEKLRSLMPGIGLSSFDIKLVVIEHHYNCTRIDQATCVIDVLKEINIRNQERHYMKSTVYDRSLHWDHAEEKRKLLDEASSNIGLILPSQLLDHYKINTKLFDNTIDMTEIFSSQARESNSTTNSLKREPVAVMVYHYVSIILWFHVILGVLRECVDSIKPTIIRSVCIYYTLINFSYRATMVLYSDFNWLHIALSLIVLDFFRTRYQEAGDCYFSVSLKNIILCVAGVCFLWYSITVFGIVFTTMVTMHCYQIYDLRWNFVCGASKFPKRCYIPIVFEILIRVCIVYLIYADLRLGQHSLRSALQKISLQRTATSVMVKLWNISQVFAVIYNDAVYVLKWLIIGYNCMLIFKYDSNKLNKVGVFISNINMIVFLLHLLEKFTNMWPIIVGIVAVEYVSNLLSIDENSTMNFRQTFRYISTTDVRQTINNVRDCLTAQHVGTCTMLVIGNVRFRAGLLIMLYSVLNIRYRILLISILAAQICVKLLTFQFSGSSMMLWHIS